MSRLEFRLIPWSLSSRLTHEVTEDTPYYLKANGVSPPSRPMESYLQKPEFYCTGGRCSNGRIEQMGHVQWTKDGDIAFIDIEKYGLKRL